MVNGVTYSNGTTNTSTSTAGTDELGKEQFLELMIAQLKYQDPLSPLEGTEFTAQLAQFSSLEQLTNMSDALDDSVAANLTLTQAINNTMTATLIGKAVKLNSTEITYDGQDEAGIGYKLPASAGEVSVKIYNAAGTLVRTIEDLPTSEGDHKLSWDFTDNDGKKIGNGTYTFEVEAKTTGGKEMVVDEYSIGVIDAVRFSSAGTMVVIDGIEHSISEISEILNADTSDSGDSKDGGGK